MKLNERESLITNCNVLYNVYYIIIIQESQIPELNIKRIYFEEEKTL